MPYIKTLHLFGIPYNVDIGALRKVLPQILHQKIARQLGAFELLFLKFTAVIKKNAATDIAQESLWSQTTV